MLLFPHSQSARSSSLTSRRLEAAAMKAAKRGALTMAIFLVCYLPLMVTLLVLTFGHPVYETVMVLEGLTLPVSYVHALASPLVVMRVDLELRARVTDVLGALKSWTCSRTGPAQERARSERG